MPPADTQKASLAVVALLDEVVLASSAFHREEWAQMPLALELFQEPRAGQVVFENLEDVLRIPGENTHITDLLDVYLLILLLGFEGKFSGRRAEVRRFIDRIRDRTLNTRARISRITPDVELISYPPPIARPIQPGRQLLKLAVVSICSALLVFLVLKLFLWWLAASVASDFAQRGS